MPRAPRTPEQKAIRNAQQKAAYAADPEKFKAKAKQYRARTDANREKLREKARAYYEENREKVLEQKRAWALAHPEQMAEKHRKSREYKERTGYSARYRAEHKELAREQGKAWRQRIRLEVIAAYGGRCSCCGEDFEPYLEVDHVNGAGLAHRRSITATFSMVIKKEGFPPDYQILCANCHRAKTKGVACRHGAVDVRLGEGPLQ